MITDPKSFDDHTAAALVAILGAADAVFYPERVGGENWRANAYAARQAFAEAGVPWVPAGATEAGRKASQRSLEELDAAGLVTVTRGRGKRALVKLTDPADAAARKLCGIPGPYCGWLSLVELSKCSTRPPEMITDLWVAESLLADSPPKAHELAAVASLMLPALVRGWVIGNSDVAGRISYAIEPAGWALLDTGAEFEDDEPTEPADAALVRLYEECLAETRSRLNTDEPDDTQEIGLMPLPCSMQGIRLENDR